MKSPSQLFSKLLKPNKMSSSTADSQYSTTLLYLDDSDHSTSIIGTPKLESRVTTETLLKCHLQEQSALFAKLPAELRNNVFELATQPDDDTDHKYAESDFWSRPGCRAKPKYNTNLLLTCRRAWLESNSLPLRQARFAFWFKDEDRRPPWTQREVPRARPQTHLLRSRRDIRPTRESEETRFCRFFRSLTPANLASIQTVQFFPQMYWLEHHGNLEYFLTRTINFHDPGTRVQWPPNVVFTIKHTDWWFWESDQPLRMQDRWISMLLTHDSFSGAETFRLELETLKLKERQLQALVSDVKQRHASAGQWSIEQSSGAEIMSWSMPSDIGDHRSHTYKHLGKLDLVVYELVWHRTGDRTPVQIKEKGIMGMLGSYSGTERA